MFTGIITQVGKVRSCDRAGSSMAIEIECLDKDLELGESIAVDGTCLTVSRQIPGGFRAEVSAETLRLTTLGQIAIGARVNLERALTLRDRLGGHLVAGHVDGIGKIASRKPIADSEQWTIEAPSSVLRFIAVKGSVAVDGVSLTVNGLSATTFELMLVPFTLSATMLASKPIGSSVNLEVDILARYVARALQTAGNESGAGVTLELLARQGYLDQETRK